MKQIKHMIQMREKAEQEKQATNQAILDEHIVDEIEQDLKACTCHDGGTPPAPSATCIKSCLKKKPTKEAGYKDDGETSRTKNSKSKKQKNKHRQASNDYSSSNSLTIAAH
ncbi:hypothetical protein INT44_009075 [Umbelopsis vinacea]|uniref:Uncharacterized protein n=1 Tax=Umbelopsis vinacea TaxID=44442 RepID=A0A8H7Q211_9FUNG|nr:hypothetical protein INT44_009075 [Umbelopsis vinacea]